MVPSPSFCGTMICSKNTRSQGGSECATAAASASIRSKLCSSAGSDAHVSSTTRKCQNSGIPSGSAPDGGNGWNGRASRPTIRAVGFPRPQKALRLRPFWAKSAAPPGFGARLCFDRSASPGPAGVHGSGYLLFASSPSGAPPFECITGIGRPIPPVGRPLVSKLSAG